MRKRHRGALCRTKGPKREEEGGLSFDRSMEKAEPATEERGYFFPLARWPLFSGETGPDLLPRRRLVRESLAALTSPLPANGAIRHFLAARFFPIDVNSEISILAEKRGKRNTVAARK